jgi:hypothetical protein
MPQVGTTGKRKREGEIAHKLELFTSTAVRISDLKKIYAFM